MGTRSLTCVVSGGEYKIAQYCQWNGYSSGQGASILEFIKNQEQVEQLKSSLPKVRFLDTEGKDKSFIEEYNANAPEWSSDPDNRTDEQKHWFETYCSRDIGSKILNNIANSADQEIILRNQLPFAGDSLMCEYCYVIDFDTNTFEIFKGFNKKTITEGRFLSSDESLSICDGYEPVILVKTYKLDDLPSEELFLSDL